MKKQHLAFAALFIAFGIATRFIDHPANFAPLTAIALLSGYFFDRKYSWAIALLAIFLSDAVLGFYNPAVMAAVYASYAAVWGIGLWAKKQESGFALLPSTLFASILFFVVTNFAVWAFTPLYSKTLAGLGLSYTMAIPFFKWSLAGDILYAGALFGMVVVVEKLVVKRKQLQSQAVIN